MSIQSRLRQSQRDALLGRTKPLAVRRRAERYAPAPFNVTEFQHHAHTQLTELIQESRDSAAGDRGVMLPRRAAAHSARVQNWAPWGRDGFETEAEYYVEHRPASLAAALLSGDPSFPHFAIAQEARKLGLI